MSLIHRALIKQLKEQVLLIYLCKHYNIDLQLHGNNFYGYCPFHEDASLSLIIDPRTNRWKCRKPCCRGGDSIRFVMKLEKINFREAIKKIRAFHRNKIFC